MKLIKRTGIYKASNATFDPKKLEAFSYSWWKFVGVVEGKVVFNNFRYSPTTATHQYRVRQLMAELGIRIDLEIPVPVGLPGTYGSYSRFGQESCPTNSMTLAEIIQYAEETVCNSILEKKLKAQDRYQRNKDRKAALKRSENRAVALSLVVGGES